MRVIHFIKKDTLFAMYVHRTLLLMIKQQIGT